MNKKIKFPAMKALTIALLLAVCSVPRVLEARTLYYYEDFSSAASVLVTNGWNTNFPMSRDFWNDNAPGFAISNQTGLNRFIMAGDPNGNTAYDQWYTGKGNLFRPVSNAQLGKSDVTASEEEPFGFMVVRYCTFVHREVTAAHDLDAYGNFDPNYGKGLLEVWMAEDNGAKQFGDSFENFIFWYDKAFNRWSSVDGASETISNNIWGYYNLYERDNSGYYDLNWTNLIDIDGNSINPNGAFRRQYTYAGGLAQNEGGTNASSATNEMAIKMLHNGRKISIFLNLDPAGDNSGSLKNSWIKFAEVPASWSNKLVAYFAAESPTPNAALQYTYTQYKHFLVRSVNSNLVASVFPTNTTTNVLTTFTLSISNNMGTTNESGIIEIAVKKPASFLSNWILTNVVITNQYGGLTSTNTNMNPPAGKFSLTTNLSGEMVIRFRAATSGDHQIVNSNSVIKVNFLLFSAPTPNSTGDTFEVYADSYKHDDNGIDWVFDNGNGIKYATTGRKKAAAAFNNALLVKAFGQCSADGDVTVASIPYYQGTPETTFTYKIDTSRSVNSPDISSVAIVVPDAGFANISNINSKILGPLSPTNAVFTNYLASLGISNCIFINYGAVGQGIAGLNGSDKITFNVYGTASLPLGTKTSNYQWKSYVSSSAFISGTTWQQTTNTNFLVKQFVALIAKSPVASGSILPFSVAINASVVSNVISNATYTVVNKGEAGNDILKLKIAVPAEFTNVTFVRSSWLGTNTNGTTFAYSNQTIFVTYTNTNYSTNFRLLAGSNDVLTFNTIHMITNLDTNTMYREWMVYGDNGNTEGLVLGTENAPGHWGVIISPPMALGENKIANPLVYTSDITNTITNIIYNTSPLGVNVRMAKVVLPTWFTNVLSVTSTHISNTLTNIIVTNLNGTNLVYLYYQGTNGTLDTGGYLRSVNDVPAENDTVVIRTLDRIDWDSFTNTNYQLTNLIIRTVMYKTNAETSDTNYYSNCVIGTYSLTNFLTVEFPPLSASFRIDTNIIDTTTVTNTLYYTVTNSGLPGNRIKKVLITLDPAIVSNIISASSGLLGDISSGIASNIITADYASGSSILWGGSNDVITFVLLDKIDGQKYGPVGIYPTIWNDRETKLVTNIMAGGSGNLTFDIPKPHGGSGIMPNIYFTGTNASQSFVVTASNMGTGTDVFQKLQIAFPASFTNNRVTNVASQWLGMDSTANPAYVKLTATNVLLIYTNDMMPAGSNDVITLLTAYSNLAVGETNNWTISAFNGFQFLGNDYFELLTNAILGDTNTYITEMPTANLTPVSALTTDLSNVFVMTVRNGTNTASRSIATVKVDIPYPYQPAGLVVNYLSGKGFTSYVSNGSVYLNYGTNFTGNNFTTFNIIANKNYITVPTNSTWTASALYNGDSGGYRTIVIHGTNSVTVNVVLPDSQSYASVTPKLVGKDLVKSDYSITITNIGVVGNDALIAKILPPYTNAFTNIITNINNLSNTLGGDLVYTNGYILVRYHLSNTNLPAKKTDTIFFTGYDNQNLPGYSGQWTVFIGNTTNTNSFIQSQVLLSGDLDFLVIQPGYRSDYRITPNTADTSHYTHTFSAIVNNSGGIGNDVKVVRVYLPQPYITNGIVLNSTLALSNLLTNYNGTNVIEFTYVSNKFITGTNDTVTITASNSLSLGDTNVWVRIAANYYTSELSYSDSDVQVGTNLIQMLMPQSMVEAKVLTNEIYTTHKGFSVAYRFINKGLGSNRVNRAWITVPAIFTNAANTIFVSGKVSNTNWSGNVLTIDYTNFNSGDTDTVVFNMTNSIGFESNVYVDARFFNGEYTNTADEAGNYDMSVNVVNPPSANVTPLTVMSTDYTNDLVLYYNNNSSGTLPTMALRIDLPSVYTNVLSAVSSNGTAFISNTTVYVTNFGGGNGLPKNGVDYITLKAMDSVTKGYVSNISWITNGHVYADNGTGLGLARETIFGSLNQSLSMPKPNLQAYLETTWFYVATNASDITNNVRIKLINNGIGANTLNTVKIVFPMPAAAPNYLTNVVISSVSNDRITNLSASIRFINSNTMVLYYTNDFPGEGMKAASTNTLSFDLYYNIQNSGTYPFGIYGENGSSDGYVLASNVSPQTTLLSLVTPEQKSEMYIYDRPVIYTLDTNNVIGYKVNNNSYSFGVQNVWIPFDTNILPNVVRISSSWLGSTNIAFTLTNMGLTNGILIDYGVLPLDKRKFDNLGILVNYSCSNTTNMGMAGMIKFSGSGYFEDTLIPEGNTATLALEVPDFGRVYGWVLPGYLNSGLKVVGTNSDTIVTNKFGTNVTATADGTGYFLLDFIPQGTYDIVIYASKYKDIRLATFQVLSNAATNVMTNVMRHSALNARDTGNQEMQSQSDSQTKVVVYPNAIVRSFSLDIWLTNMYPPEMRTAVGTTKTVSTPVDATVLNMYWMDMRDANDQPLEEQELTNDVLMQFHYTDAEMTAQNWAENKLSVYYWRPMTGEWVRVGGAVDTTANTVTIKASYLHKYYALLGEDPNVKKAATGFVSVRTDPKVFSPKSGNLKLSIGFDGVVDKYTVKIYNMRGGLVKSYERTGTYGQGEVFWDGKDDEGYDVKGGIYVYRITAGANTYSGSIVIAR